MKAVSSNRNGLRLFRPFNFGLRRFVCAAFFQSRILTTNHTNLHEIGPRAEGAKGRANSPSEPENKEIFSPPASLEESQRTTEEIF